MTILITGGAGFIGFNLAKRLKEADLEVIIFDCSIEEIKDEEERFIIICGDISKIEDLEEVCKKYSIDTIFHLAGIFPPATEEDPYMAFKINLEGTLNILTLASKYGIKKVIYTSSATIFGPDREPPFTEEELLHPWTVYSSFKVSSEILGAIYSKKYDFSFRAVRFPIVIGPGRDRFLGMTKYPIEMVEEAIEGKPYEVTVSPETRMPIIFVDDAVQILINLWRTEVHFEIYNIDGLWVTARELAEGIKKIIPAAEITFKPVKKDELLDRAVSSIKEKKEETKFTFRTQRLLDEILQEYISRLSESKD